MFKNNKISNKPSYIITLLKRLWFFIINIFKSCYKIYNDVSKSNIFNFISFVTGIILTLIVEPYLESIISKIIAITLIVISVTWVFFFHYAKRYNNKIRTLIFCCIFTGILILLSIYIKNKYEPIPNICDNPQTLLDYFNCDFGNTNSFGFTKSLHFYDTLNVSDTFSIKFEFVVIMDYKLLSYFYKIYVYDNMNTSKFFLSIPRICNDLQLDNRFKDYAIPEPFKDKAKNLSDMTFTKRIYVYHETVIPNIEIEKIQAYLKKTNLNVEFRGPLYADVNEKKKYDSVFIKTYIH